MIIDDFMFTQMPPSYDTDPITEDGNRLIRMGISLSFLKRFKLYIFLNRLRSEIYLTFMIKSNNELMLYL